jgi:hypothetical protein
MGYSFGSGNVTAVPVSGLTDLTPVQFGTLQDISVDFDFSTKQLMGQSQFPVAVARASGKITGKAKLANFSARQFNLLFGSAVSTTTQTNQVYGEAGAIATNSYTAANGSTFVQDLGVVYASTGKAFAKVASAPALGQYSVSSSGVYTFNSSEIANTAILVSYTYTSTGGNTINISNQLAGQQPVTKLFLNEGYNGVFTSMTLNSIIFSKLSLDFKNEDFTVPELDFEAFADAAGNIASVSLATA